MSWTRKLVSALMSVALLIAPMSAALASGDAAGTLVPAHANVHETHGDGVTAASMHDCPGFTGTAGDVDCPHCAKDKACSPTVCLAKCFQMLGLVLQPGVELRLAGLPSRPADIARPPDRTLRPQIPPPRT